MPEYDVELEIEYYDPATLTAAPTAATGLEYTGVAQNLINAGTATGGTLYYGLGTSEAAPTDASAWSETVPTGTDVGQYYVWYKVVGDGTHGDIAAAGPLEVNIAKATPTISEAPTAGAITYGQTLAASTLNGGSATCNSQTVAGSFAWTTSTTAPSVSDSENTEYSVTFTPTDGTNYNSATTNVKLTVNPVSAVGLTLTLSSESFTYNGEAQEPTVTVKDGETTLTQDTHYTVSYSNNTNAALSTAENAPTVTITGMGNYSGTASKKFTIAPKSLTDGMIQAIADQSYTGSALTPDITVKDGETTLVLGSDYESVTFTNNTNAALSTAENAPTVTITGKGNYTGTVSAKFTIAAADIAAIDITAPTANTLNFTGQAQALIEAGSVSGGIGTMQYSLDGTNWSTDIPTGTDEGDYTVYYKVVGDDNHNDVAAQSFKVTIGEALDIDLTSTDGKTWTLASMPYYDVELEVEYYPAATLVDGTDQAPAVSADPVYVSTDAPLFTAGSASQGTLMYAISTSDTEAPAITAFTATVPTAQSYTEPTTLYAWYYILGSDAGVGGATATYGNSEVFGPLTVKLHRNLFDGVSAVLDNGSRVRLIMNEGKYQPIEPLTYTLTDISDAENPKTLVSGTDYTYGGLQRLEDGSFVDVTDESNLPPGTYRAQFNGMGDFAGWKPTDSVFELYYGYEVYVPAHEYVTYCSTEALTLEDENAALYTITAVSNSEATLSRALTVAPATTPLLVENNSDESRTILLIPTDKQADDVTPATEFIGVLTAERTLAKNDNFDYYAFNGLDFVYVVNPVDIPVGKCFIGIQTGNLSARSITIRRSATAIDATLMNNEEMNNEQWFDLNGRKVNKPTKKGVFINNGRKVVIK
jgi:hypothetical protein